MPGFVGQQGDGFKGDGLKPSGGGFVARPGGFGQDTPIHVPFPTTADGWTRLGVTAPTHIWPMQEAASPLVDTIAGAQLALTGGCDLGIDGYYGRKALRFDDTLQRAAHASTSFLDVDASTSITVALALRMPANPADYRGLCGKRDDVAPNAGWGFSLTPSGGISVVLDSGVDSVIWEENGVSYCDGKDHGLFLVHDEAADVARVHSDRGNFTSPSTAAVVSMVNTKAFAFGWVLGTSLSAAEGLLISYAAVWLGTALTAADFKKWWTP